MELPFVFNSFHSSQGKLILKASNNKKVKQLSEKIQSAWLSFAHTGKPGNDENIWPQYNENTRATMIINNTFNLTTDPTEKFREGWESIFPSAARSVPSPTNSNIISD
jgi:para-nitrobenzyl esterase